VPDRASPPNNVQLFLFFFSISALTIGGGYAMIPVFADRIVKKNWMDEKEFYDLFAVGQSFPGPMALNTAVLFGQRMQGMSGAVVSFLGILLPPFGAIVLVSLLFSRISEVPFVKGFLIGSYGVVLGLVASLLYKMVRTKKWSLPELLLAFLGTVALIVFKGYALPVFVVLISLAYIGKSKWNF